jgi:hypothetical protein
MATTDKLSESINRIAAAIRDCKGAADDGELRDGLEATLCLATREAYSDFHAHSLISDHVDVGAKRLLGKLLREAVGTFRNETFATAVEERLQDFEQFCRLMEAGDETLLELALDIAVKNSDT